MEACSDYRERQNIRCALREIKGLGLGVNTIPTYSSFPRNSTRRHKSDRLRDDDHKSPDKLEKGLISRAEKSPWSTGRRKNLRLGELDDNIDKHYTLKKYFESNGELADRLDIDNDNDKSKDKNTDENANVKQVVNKSSNSFRSYLSVGSLNNAWDSPKSAVLIGSSNKNRESPKSAVLIGSSNKNRDSPRSTILVGSSNKNRDSPRSTILVGSLNKNRESPRSAKEGTFRAKKINITRVKVLDKDLQDKSTETEEGAVNTSKEDEDDYKELNGGYRTVDRVITPTKWKSAETLTNKRSPVHSKSFSYSRDRNSVKKSGNKNSKLVSNIISQFESQDKNAADERNGSVKNYGEKVVNNNNSVNSSKSKEKDGVNSRNNSFINDCDINDSMPVDDTSSPRLKFLKSLGSRVITSPRKPRKIASYRSSGYSVGPSVSDSLEQRARLQSAPPVVETEKSENIILESRRILSEEIPKMKEQTQFSCGVLENSLIVSPVSESSDRKMMSEIVDSIDGNVNDVFKEGTDTVTSTPRKKMGLSRKGRVDSDERKFVKKYRKKTADSEDCDKSTESRSVESSYVPKVETVMATKVLTNTPSVKKGKKVVRRKLPEIPVKLESDDDESIHERTIRLLQERKIERKEKVTPVSEITEKDKTKMSPADLKKSLEEKLQRSDSKKKAVRVRRELQLLNRENERKANLSRSNSESESAPPTKVQVSVEDKEIANLTKKMGKGTNSQLAKDKYHMSGYVQRSKSDVVKIRRAISETDAMFGSKGAAVLGLERNKVVEELLKEENALNPVEKINVIGNLMQEEAKLQELVSLCN